MYVICDLIDGISMVNKWEYKGFSRNKEINCDDFIYELENNLNKESTKCKLSISDAKKILKMDYGINRLYGKRISKK